MGLGDCIARDVRHLASFRQSTVHEQIRSVGEAWDTMLDVNVIHA